MPAQDAFDILADPANRDVNRTTIREGLWTRRDLRGAVEVDGRPGHGVREGRQGRRGDRPAQGGRGQRRGLAVPVELRVLRQGHRHRAAQDDGRADGQGARGRRDPAQGWQRTLTIASIVEGEVNGDADRAEGRPRHPQPARRRPAQLRAAPDGLHGALHRARSAARPAPRTSSAPPTAPTTPTRSRGCRPVRSATPARPRSRRPPTRPTGTGTSSSRSTRARARRSSPRPRRSTTATSQEFQAWCSANPGKC